DQDQKPDQKQSNSNSNPKARNCIPCGSWLACDGGVSVDKCIGRYTAIAAMRRPDNPAPTGVVFAPDI
ncbi:MAG: hypothetical protein U1C13_11365, partial [Pseudomonas sp.]|nr:hypothetical protein [Pseudomonas sp.]